MKSRSHDNKKNVSVPGEEEKRMTLSRARDSDRVTLFPLPPVFYSFFFLSDFPCLGCEVHHSATASRPPNFSLSSNGRRCGKVTGGWTVRWKSIFLLSSLLLCFYVSCSIPIINFFLSLTLPVLSPFIRTTYFHTVDCMCFSLFNMYIPDWMFRIVWTSLDIFEFGSDNDQDFEPKIRRVFRSQDDRWFLGEENNRFTKKLGVVEFLDEDQLSIIHPVSD